MAGKKVKGTVKWFSARRGYGFITDEDGIDYFAHFSEIQEEGFKKLRTGQQVTFECSEDEKGRGMAKGIQPEAVEEQGADVKSEE